MSTAMDRDKHEWSGEINELADALAKFQSEMEGAKKDSVNPHFKSKYADLESVREACRPMARHGLSYVQPVTAEGPRVTVTTILMHKSGQWISSSLSIAATQNTPQAVGSAITYGRRYGLSAMVGIAPEDDDGQAASSTSSRTTAPLRQLVVDDSDIPVSMGGTFEPQRPAIDRVEQARQRVNAAAKSPVFQPAAMRAKIRECVAISRIGDTQLDEILHKNGFEKLGEVSRREDGIKILADIKEAAVAKQTETEVA